MVSIEQLWLHSVANVRTARLLAAPVNAARHGVFYVVALLFLNLVYSTRAADVTFKATEQWTVVLDYDGWGGNSFTGRRTFTGTQTGTIVIQGNSYSLINRTGVQLGGIDTDLTTRTIFYNTVSASISGDFVFAPAFGATAKGIVFLGAFIISVPLIDGEVPAFYDYDHYSGSGPLSSIQGGGYMEGFSLTATVSSTLSLERVVGPPSISMQPQSQTVFTGQDVAFSVIAGGDGPLAYAWRKDGAILPGKTGSSLSLTNVQPGDAGTYSVVVSNSGGQATSAGAKLTVKPPPLAWHEGWEASPPGIRHPSSNTVVFVAGDKGRWAITDTVSVADDCGPIENYAEIRTDDGRKRLRLVAVENNFGCAENIGVEIDGTGSPLMPVPLLRDSEISFHESGAMDDPYWNGIFGCIVRPCGDTVHLRLTDDRANEVLYIFQRAPNYVEHAFTNGPSLSGYLEVFLEPAGGDFRRNLFNDFARIAGAAGPGKSIQRVEFSISAAGWAELDDLRIASTAPASDPAGPTVAISAPANNARLTEPTVMLAGTAKDDVAVALVEVRVNDGEFQPANGTATWTANLELAPGLNTVRVRAQDAAGNVSPEVSRAFVHVVGAPLTLEMAGSGTIKPDLNGQYLELGKSYKVKASPAPGYLFGGWSGSVTSSEPALTFSMSSNLVLVANFLLNPFPAIRGSYNGLFHEAEQVRHSSSGFFTLTLSDRGTYTVRIVAGGKRHGASGSFTLDGRATNVVTRPGLDALAIEWDLDLAGGLEQVRGSVSGGDWTAGLLGDRASVEAGVYEGKYTVILPGLPDANVGPGGDGFGSVAIDSRGNLSLGGSLADAAALKQRVPLSKDGLWPFYAVLYRGAGSVMGWVNFEDDGTNDLSGLVSWFKPALPKEKYYPQGFTVESQLVGSRYLAPSGTNRVLNFSEGFLILSRAGIERTNTFTLLPNSKATANGPDKVTLAINVSKGLFSGSVTPAGTRSRVAIKGALLQRQTNGAGFYLSTNLTGQVTVEPAQ